ncbi:MAG: hypothetical protein OYK82_05960 [Gammaproteobacteria bacterium]|nr:hypothetical protein [Gammaproteobacteria bacterium]
MVGAVWRAGRTADFFLGYVHPLVEAGLLAEPERLAFEAER